MLHIASALLCFLFNSCPINCWVNDHLPGGINDCSEGTNKKREALAVDQESDQSASFGNLVSK